MRQTCVCITKDRPWKPSQETTHKVCNISRCKLPGTLMAQTKAGFISKISIVIEESDESEFWLEFIIDEKLMKKEKVLPLFNEAHELASIFIVTRKTAQKNMK